VSNRGFTLLEVLVAMVVLALSLGAVIQTAADYTLNQAYLRDRTYAEWVARNQLATTLLEGQLEAAWPSIGQQKGEVEFPESSSEVGGREWRWVMKVSQTPEDDLRRLEIEVFPLNADEEQPPLARLSGFMGKPQ
jgi:general secretion pathway protein I